VRRAPPGATPVSGIAPDADDGGGGSAFLTAPDQNGAMFRRRARRPSLVELTLLGFGSDEELIAYYGSLERAAAAWRRHREEVMAHWPNGRPQAWWRFEPEVPDDLRTGPPLVLTRADARAWDELEARRRAFLAARGESRPGPI